MNDFLETIKQKRQEKAEKDAQDFALLKQTSTVKSTNKKLTDTIKGETERKLSMNQPVEVRNLPSLALSSDIERVVKALEAIKIENKPEAIDWQPLTSALDTVCQKLDEIPKENPEMPEAVEEVTIKNISDFTAALKPLIEVISKKDYKPVFTPNIQVESPEVEVEVPEIDMKPVAEAIDSLKKELTRLEQPELDLTQLINATSATTDAINGLRFPVPNYILPFKATDGKATQIQLDSSGNLPVVAGTTNYKKKIDKATTDIIYIGSAALGSATSSAVWQIKKIDKTVTDNVTITFADAGAFTATWDDRATESYT